MKKLFLSAIILSTIGMSCKKEDSAPIICTTNMTSIAGSYKTTAIRYKANSLAPEQDFFVILDDCEKDDLIKLNANGTANYQDAGNTCSPNGSYLSTWSLSGNTIIIDGMQGVIQFFDCKKLVISASGVFAPGDYFTIIYQKE
jgi:hypothetical protein